MIQKKICILGAFSVGKTSLIQRYVSSIFSEKYLTTVGVKIDKKPLKLHGKEINLMIWDIAGEDDFTSIRTSYLRGMAGYILVIDGTRPNTCDTALSIYQMVRETMGELPAVFAINKADLKNDWQLDVRQLNQLKLSGHPIMETSAKQASGVEDIFLLLADRMERQHG